MKQFIAFCVAFVTLILLDFIWIGLIAHSLYYTSLSAFLAPQVNYVPAVVFYALYAIALLYFAIFPALKKQSVVAAVLVGAYLGFTVYMAYDLTNLALIAKWPALLSLVDVAWGTLLSTIASLVAYLVVKKVTRD